MYPGAFRPFDQGAVDIQIGLTTSTRSHSGDFERASKPLPFTLSFPMDIPVVSTADATEIAAAFYTDAAHSSWGTSCGECNPGKFTPEFMTYIVLNLGWDANDDLPKLMGGLMADALEKVIGWAIDDNGQEASGRSATTIASRSSSAR